MSNVTPMVTNDLTETLAKLLSGVKSGAVTSLVIMAQHEDADGIWWESEQAGEIGDDPYHIAAFVGHLDILQHYARDVYLEVIE